jgi:solute:Na+ symporter, SSS family
LLDSVPPALSTIDGLIVLGFLVLVSIVGYVMSKAASGGLDDYFLGGNKIPWWVLGISTSTSNFDMAGTMIIVSVIFSLGLSGFFVELRGGVGLTLAFLMVFLAKWLRRSRVMTSAEWMKLRFGTDSQGRAAHLLSALANIVLSLGMIIYFSKGAGAFLTHFLPFSELTCTTVMVAIGLFYTLMSGLYGVVFTDVLQMILLTFTAIYVSVRAFWLRPEVVLPDGFLSLTLERPPLADAFLADMAGDPGRLSEWEPILQVFGLCVAMWVMRTVLEGMGGVGGYVDQRFFAARNEREASLLTFESIVLSLMRWVMVAGLVIMGYHVVQQGGAGASAIAEDSEAVLPIVLAQMLPVGVKGFVISGLIAAAMSTFDSTLNAGASYIVKDVYQTYVNPVANGEQLMRVSRWATVGLCVAGIALAAVVPNINAIWGLITMGLGAGMFVPLFLRWYWPRFNGYGFASGTAVGVIAALVFDAGLDLPLYIAFPSIVGSALVGAVGVTLLTDPTDDRTLEAFYVQTNPWGLWGRIHARAIASGRISAQEGGAMWWEKTNDLIAVFFAVPFQLSLLLAGMTFMFHEWMSFTGFALVAGTTGVGLYFFWFRNLKSTEQCELDDARYAAEHGGKAPSASVGH